MHLPTSYDISYTLGKAIPLCCLSGNRLKKEKIYDRISQLVRLYGDRYQDAVVKGVFINIYYESKESLKSLDFPNIPEKDIIGKIIKDSDIISSYLPEVKSLMYKHSRIPSKINAIKGNNMKECRPFIVADIERVMVNNVHFPYAA